MANHNEIDSCIYELNDLHFLLTKSDKWEGMSKKLSNLLKQKWNKEQESAIKEAIEFLNQEGNLNENDINVLFDDLKDKLGSRIAEVFRKDVTKFQLESYTKGATGVGIKFEFNTVDKKALSWLFRKDIAEFWIGESHNKQLSERLAKLGTEVLELGLTKKDAAVYFRDSLGGTFNKSLSYWELMADHIVTRAREFGKVSAFEQAGVTHIKYYNPAPETDLCRYLNGKVVPVGNMIVQRDKLMAAETLEAVKLIAPWYKPKEVNKIIDSGKLPEGLGTPPFHAHCKTSAVIAYADEIEAAELEAAAVNKWISIIKKIFGRN
jgi:hypothetical protein